MVAPESSGVDPRSRRWLVAALDEFRDSHGRGAVVWSILDGLLFTTAVAQAAHGDGSLAVRGVWSLVAGVAIARLFILGHDACHGSAYRSPVLNALAGRLLFLPSLTPFSLWHVGHNVAHHGFNNVRGRDYVWAPISLEDYRALSRVRRFVYRLYRSGFFPGLYYGIELWWKRLFWPSRRHVGAVRRIFVMDSLCVSGFVVLWITFLVLGSNPTVGSATWAVMLGFVVPWATWLTIVGFVVYVQHTHPEVAWHRERSSWAASHGYIADVVSVSLPFSFDRVLHNIMEHAAHHADPRIPSGNLRCAQQRLEQMHPCLCKRSRLTLRLYLGIAAACKLYDFDQCTWIDFQGRRTS